MAKATTTNKLRTPRRRLSADGDGSAEDTPQTTAVPDAEVGDSPAPAPLFEAETPPGPSSPIDAETNAKYEEIKHGSIHITELQRMSVQELHDVAKKEGLEEYTGLKKQDLIFMILKD
ncbi:MAG: Rho termination factor N-terminal domain-containing protein, partial [Phycisphaerales bacterium]|nr:Rho termination factor N-terminal domain-containing protein [Phycisphaerales bacterium]